MCIRDSSEIVPSGFVNVHDSASSVQPAGMSMEALRLPKSVFTISGADGVGSGVFSGVGVIVGAADGTDASCVVDGTVSSPGTDDSSFPPYTPAAGNITANTTTAAAAPIISHLKRAFSFIIFKNPFSRFSSCTVDRFAARSVTPAVTRCSIDPVFRCV